MSVTIQDFRFEGTDEPDVEDDMYVLKTNERIYIQANPYGYYFVPVIEDEEGVFRHLKSCKTIDQAILVINKEVDA